MPLIRPDARTWTDHSSERASNRPAGGTKGMSCLTSTSFGTGFHISLLPPLLQTSILIQVSGVEEVVIKAIHFPRPRCGEWEKSLIKGSTKIDLFHFQLPPIPRSLDTPSHSRPEIPRQSESLRNRDDFVVLFFPSIPLCQGVVCLYFVFLGLVVVAITSLRPPILDSGRIRR